MRVIFSILLVLFSLAAVAQERYKADSLLQVLPATSGKARVEILRHLSRAYIGANKEKSIAYAKESLAEAEKLKNDTFIVRSLNNLAAAFQNSGDRRSSLPYLDQAIEITRKNGNLIQLLECLEFKATAYAGMRQTDKALPFAQEGLAISKQLKDSVGILNAMEIIAAAHKDLQQLDAAVQVYQQELELLQFLPKRMFEKGRVCVNLGEVYSKQGRETEAIALFDQGRKYFDQMGYLVGALVAILDMANSYLDDEQLQKAGAAFREVLSLNEAIQEPELNAQAYTGLGVIDLEKQNYPSALAYLKQAEGWAKPAGLQSVLKNIYGYMTDLYCLQGDYKTAKTFKVLSNNYADSIVTADVRDRLGELQIQYETAEKELKITEQENEIFRTNALNYGLFGSLIAFFLLAWLFYNRFRLRKKAELDAAVIREQKLGLNAVIEAQEAERKRMAKELHDGIAQELVALKLGLDAHGRQVGKIAPDQTTQVEALKAQLDTTCTDVRSIAHAMSPPVLTQQGLAPSLEQLLRYTTQHIGLQANLYAHDLPSRLDEKTALGLYRITQELLNNIVKHARAAKVLVELYVADSNLILRVEDDGVGFNFDEARARGSMGLLNILSRASALGGAFNTESLQPQGTVAMVRIPI